MLSTAAFNALLKTLEEPPDRVTFILATTDPQRVLPTIISRCQRFDFRRIPLDSMVKHLGKIAANENINIHIEALTLVAQIAQGGLRDAESLLDQLSLLDGEITVEAVWDLVGSVPEQDLLSLIEAIAADHSTQLIDYVRRIMDRGREPLIVLQNLANVYRDLLIAKTASDRSDLVAMTSSGWTRLVQLAQTLPVPNILLGQQHLRSAELQIRNSTQPRLWLEVTLMGLLPSAQGAIAQSHPQSQGTQSQAFIAPRNIPATPQITSQTSKINPPLEVSTPPKQDLPVETPISSGNDDFESFASVGYDLDQLWQNLLLMLPTPTKSIFVQMEGRFLEIDTNSVKIGLGGKRDETTKNIAVQKRPELENACAKLLQRPIKVMFKFVANPQPEESQTQVHAPLPHSPAIATPVISSPVISSPVVSSPVTSSAASPPPIPSTHLTNNAAINSVSNPVTASPPNLESSGNNSKPIPANNPQSKGYVGLSEEEKIVRNMADFFNGQVIDLDEDPTAQTNSSE
jgi:DNA polymerase-3 subunit gamma/tau